MHTQTQHTAALAAVCKLATTQALQPAHRSTRQFIIDLRSHLATYPVSAHTTDALLQLWRNCRRTNGSTPAVDYTDAHLLTGADGLQGRIVQLLQTQAAPALLTGAGAWPPWHMTAARLWCACSNHAAPHACKALQPQWHISADHPGKKGPLWNDAHALLHKVCAQTSPDHTLQLQVWYAGLRPRLYDLQLQRAWWCLHKRTAAAAHLRCVHKRTACGDSTPLRAQAMVTSGWGPWWCRGNEVPVSASPRSPRDLRWYPCAKQELQACCHAVPSPTHRRALTLFLHCSTLEHIAHLYGVNLADLQALQSAKQ